MQFYSSHLYSDAPVPMFIQTEELASYTKEEEVPEEPVEETPPELTTSTLTEEEEEGGEESTRAFAEPTGLYTEKDAEGKRTTS